MFGYKSSKYGNNKALINISNNFNQCSSDCADSHLFINLSSKYVDLNKYLSFDKNSCNLYTQ